MHSSRMRTARWVTVSGGYLLKGEGVCLSRGIVRRAPPPPPPREEADSCGNITFSQLRLRVVKSEKRAV